MSEPIPYAHPVVRDGPRVWASAAIVFAGLALIVLGGCFMIGILNVLNPAAFGASPTAAPGPSTRAQTIFVVILGVLAAGCFLSAILLLVSGIRGLLAVLNRR